MDDAPQALGAGTGVAARGEEKLEELGGGRSSAATKKEPEALQQMGSAELRSQIKGAPSDAGPPPEFYTYFASVCGIFGLLLIYYYWIMEAEQFEMLKLLISSVMPLGILTVVVLGGDPVRHHDRDGIGRGRRRRRVPAGVPGPDTGLEAHQGSGVPHRQDHRDGVLAVRRLGAVLGGVRHPRRPGAAGDWVLSLNMTPLQFMILSQAIIFVLGWPLEWTEIIVIFVPIFLPMLKHFNIDPILWGVLVFVNLQAAFLSPPVAMSAFYLKGVAPKHVTLNQIFAGMMPYMLIVILCMVIMYIWPGMTLWLPNYLYGG